MKILHKLFSFFTFLLIGYTALSISGCAAIFGGSKKVTILTQQDSTQITVIPNSNHGHDGIHTFTIPGRMGHIRLKNSSRYYEIRQDKPGYYSNTSTAAASNFNGWKLADIGIPLTCDFILLTYPGDNNNSQSNANSTYSSIAPFLVVYGSLGWFDIFFGSWSRFNSSYTLPAMDKIPVLKKSDSTKKVYVKDVSINIPKDSMVECYYWSQETYQKNQVLRKNNIEESFHIKHTVFRDSLNDYLEKYNYIDTTKGFFSFAYKNTCYLRCNVDGITISTIGNNTVFKVRSDWKLFGVTGENEIYKATVTGSSSIENFYVSEFTVRNLITIALTQSLTNFLNSDTVSRCLSSRSDKLKALNDWNVLSFSDSGKVTSLQEAVKAVVTVKVPGGHGSGCIISSDGYLVTNYHVISDDTNDEVKVITSDGDSLKAKYVRSNSSYDLALFKLEKPGHYKFFSPNLSPEINVGTEVYAIGTPTDIELGQTLTRGIISSKRKVGDRTLIQTDVSINPGNSGGGLVNSKGELQGIVNASLIRFGVQGIGFAIPAHYIEDALKVKFIQNP